MHLGLCHFAALYGGKKCGCPSGNHNHAFNQLTLMVAGAQAVSVHNPEGQKTHYSVISQSFRPSTASTTQTVDESIVWRKLWPMAADITRNPQNLKDLEGDFNPRSGFHTLFKWDRWLDVASITNGVQFDWDRQRSFQLNIVWKLICWETAKKDSRVLNRVWKRLSSWTWLFVGNNYERQRKPQVHMQILTMKQSKANLTLKHVKGAIKLAIVDQDDSWLRCRPEVCTSLWNVSPTELQRHDRTPTFIASLWFWA